MDRRGFLKSGAAGALASWAGASLARRCGAAESGARPTLVVFLADDHGWGDSTPYGARDVRTPNMQRLADAGMLFTHAFVASPACAPSRAALLTGLMPARNGAEANHTYPRAGVRLMPDRLRELGYESAAFGKVAHGDYAKKCGFDHVGPGVDAGTVGKYLDSRPDPARPLALFVGSRQPHVPWPENDGYDPAALNLPPTFVDTPETRDMRARYYTDVSIADAELGAIYDLARDRFGDNLIFFYSSDHGAQWPFGKWNLYDASTRTPLIVAWTGVIPPGSRSDAMVSWVDYLPTFLEILGGGPPADLDGRSFVPILRGQATELRTEIFTTHSGDGNMNVYPIRALRDRRWKYVLNLHPEFKHTTHIDRAQGKDGLTYWLSWVKAAKDNPAAAEVVKRYHLRPAEELYDLEADPHEQRNLAGDPAHAARLGDMRARLEAWMKEQGDQQTVFNTPHPPDEPELTGAETPPPAKAKAARKAAPKTKAE